MSITAELPSLSRTLVSHGGQLRIENRQLGPVAPGQLTVRVMAVGLCRTDLYAVKGWIPTFNASFIPGHEFAGIITNFGDGGDTMGQFAIGDHVVINPVAPCGKCQDCIDMQLHHCAYAKLMGVDFHGACREQLVVPVDRVHKIPKSLPFTEAAFSEPVAATLAIFKTDIRPEQNGALLGSSRISELADRVLKALGFHAVSRVSLEEAKLLDDDQFDFVIETEATTEVFSEMVRLVRPRGSLILKSRQHLPLAVTLKDVVKKEPRLHCVHYEKFEDAVRLLATGRVQVADLVGPQFPFSQSPAAFDAASCDDAQKVFLLPGI